MRIRTIKPEFFLHEGLFDLELESKLPVRVAFAGLWCAADREGRFVWEPRKLKAQILPYDDVEFSRVLDALTTRGFLVHYASGTREFGAIPSFQRHQVINNRERASEIPPPTQNATQQELDACPTREPRVPHGPLSCTSGREGNKERNKERVSTRRFIPPTMEEIKIYAGEIGLSEMETLRFEAHYGANGWRTGRNPMKDWHKAMMKWKLNGPDFNNPNGSNRPNNRPSFNRNQGTLNDPSLYSPENLRKCPNYHGPEQIPLPDPGASGNVPAGSGVRE